MQKAMGHIRAIVSRIVFIGVSAQILLGLLWMLLAFDHRQDFVGSAYAEWLDGLLFGVAYEPVIYLLQLSIAFIAGYQLIESLGTQGIFWKVWGSLALLTYPYAMQCHMAILPDSLAFSFFLLLLASGLKRNKCIYIFWLLSALFLPEYLYFGAVSVLFYFFASVKKAGSLKKIGWELLVIASVVFLALGYHKVSATEHDSPEAAWFRRTVWSSFYQFYPDWPEEVRVVITDEEYNAVTILPESMTQIVQPKVYEVMGEENAKNWFVEFGTFVFKANREQIISEVVKDAGGYLAPQVLVQLRLAGKGGTSYCARNYELMRAGHPRLTGYYVDYSGMWFAAGLVCVLFLKMISGKERKRWDKLKNKWMCTVGLVTALLMVCWYTLATAGLWDPKKALFVGELWMLAMILEVIMQGREESSGYQNS